MASGYIPLPAYQVPRNAMLDFSGLNEGIDAIGQKRELNQNRAERAEERQYQRGRNAMADKRYADETSYRRGRDTLADTRYADETAYNRGRQGVVDQRAATEFSNSQEDRTQNKFTEKVKILAPHIEKYVINEKDPALRAQRWNDVLSTPGFEGAPKQFLDPVTGPDLFMSTARKHMDGKYGKTGAIFEDRSGKTYSVQFAEDGTRKIEPFDEGMKPARGVFEVGDELVNKSDGSTRRNISENIQAAEFAKGKGQNDADFIAKYPKVQGSYKSFEQKTGNLIGYTDQQGKPVQGVIDRAIASVGPNTTGWQAVLRSLPASAARNLENDIKTIQANIAFGELQDMRANSPTGGALGAVTERELDLLSSVQASLDQLQEGVRLKENLEVVKRNLLEIQRLRREAFAMDQGRYRTLTGVPQGGASPGSKDGGQVLQGRGEGGFLPKAPLDLGNGFSLEFD